ncbi:MAG: menaquinone biosynthesis protein [Planctomycetes bacterium]|nr:menaquinone biosynthesis protein [Planctomycetota bacterium]MBM4057989.1 menaquinone biosynthesis protein [Planctomycetota bacterium]
MVDRSPSAVPVSRSSQRTDHAGPSDRRGLRIGAVSYLNTKPLIPGLAGAGIDLVLDLPSRLADGLAAGAYDVALIPSIELFRGAGERVVSDACIGCHGPVMSVKLFFRRSPAHVRTLAIDEGSRTSVALARIILAERYGVRPELEILPIGGRLSDTNADAVLLIGDRALDGRVLGERGDVGGPAGAFCLVQDLGDEWCRWTGLPFVFAVWVARAGLDDATVATLETALGSARDRGRRGLAAIAAAEAAGHGLTVEQCLGYLRDNLHYDLGPREREALALFHGKASALGLCPAPVARSRTPRPALR